MDLVNTSHTPCWRCQSINTYVGPVCEICGANLVATVPGVQVAGYPRNANVTVAQKPGWIQVPAGTHPVWLVALLSFLVGGWAGMLVNRQIVKAIVYGLIICGLATFVTCGIAAALLYPLTLIDAILVANKLNQGKAIKEWEFF